MLPLNFVTKSTARHGRAFGIGVWFSEASCRHLLLGVAFANIFQGIPIDGDGIYHGTLFTLLNPYGLLGGVLFVLLFSGAWIAVAYYKIGR